MALLMMEVVGAGLALLGTKLMLAGDHLKGFEGFDIRAQVDPVLTTVQRGTEWFRDLSDMQKGPYIVVASFLGSLLVALVGSAVLAYWHRVEDMDRVRPPRTGAFVGDQPQDAFPTMECINPANGEVLGYVSNIDKEEVKRRVQKAREAQKTWSLTSFEERRLVFRSLKKYVLYYQDEICKMSCLDTGKTMVDASLGEILVTLEKLRFCLDEGEAALRPIVRKSNPIAFYRQCEVQFLPLGVIGAIQPWNYPFHNFMNTVLSGLFAGSAVVVKPSDYSGWSSTYFCSIVQAALRHHGYSPDLVTVVTGEAETGEALVSSGIDKLFFTGSTAVGRLVAKQAAAHLLPVELELGGKDALIVCDDTDVDRAVAMAMRLTFQNGGQNCISSERLLVQGTVYDKFVDRMQEQVEALRVGDYRNLVGMVDVGAVTMGRKAIFHIQALVNDAVLNGANLLVGGEEAKFVPNGTFYKPSLLVDVTPSMRIAQEELFGPVAVVMKFHDDDECLQIVNDCAFGLNSSVFVRSDRRAQRFVREIQAGMVQVNDLTSYVNQALPFGGVKSSGYGRFGGVEGLRGCCQMKTVTRDKYPFIQTNIPKMAQYPLKEHSYAFLKEIIYLFYGSENWLAKWDNLRDMFMMSFFRKFRPQQRICEAYKFEEEMGVEDEASEMLPNSDTTQG